MWDHGFDTYLWFSVRLQCLQWISNRDNTVFDLDTDTQCSPYAQDISIQLSSPTTGSNIVQYIPRNMHTVFALLCFVVVIHWLIFLYPSGLLHWHCGNLTIAPVPAKQPWWIWRNTSCEFIMNDCITTTKQSTTKPCAYFLGYTVRCYMSNDRRWGRKSVRCWIHKGHPISCPNGWAMGCLL